MVTIRMFGRACAWAALVAACWPLAALAQAFPSKPLRIVVPYPPGGVVDVAARAVAVPLAAQLGVQVLVENRPGGGSNVGADYVARSAPDGYTMLLFADTNTIAPALYDKLNYDPVKDFAPVTMFVAGSHVLVAHPSVPVANAGELIAYAKKNPGKLSYASPGSGTGQHLGGEMFKTRAGVDIVHVPYKGGGQAITDVVGGQVPLGMLGIAPALPHIKAGKLKALAVTGKKRVPILPDVPTLAESGLAGFETGFWGGPVVPAGTPAAVVARLHAEFVKAARTPAVVERLAALGMEVVTSSSPEEFGKLIRDDIPRWPPIVKAAGAKPD